ncbi:MAG: type II toxin-antitoxin system VapC family toxin [Kiritimatiellae bacterium]|nr:type II toxin-antitoxin system VapC family toxin [Kiritimatiellia bacterium]
MIWVVDTCVILDILDRDVEFAESSSLAIQSKLDDVLTIAPITYVELAPAFNGNVLEQDAFLDGIWIHRDFDGSRDAVLLAHKAWYEHIMRKRTGEVKKRPIADVLIGAYAMQKGGLITRNETDFRALFPSLTIFNPANVFSSQQ